MIQNFEIMKKGILTFNEDHIRIVHKNKQIQIPVEDIKTIKIFRGILGDIKLKIISKNKYYIESILVKDLSDIKEQIQLLKRKKSSINIEIYLKEKDIARDNDDIKVMQKKYSYLVKIILSVLLTIIIVFGNLIFKCINEHFFNNYYSIASIENEIEREYKEIVRLDPIVKVNENEYIDDFLVAKIESNYSKSDYENIFLFMKQVDKINMAKYKNIMVYINGNHVENIADNYLSIDDDIVWQKEIKQQEIHPNSNNTYGTVLEIQNLYGSPQGYKIREYYTNEEIFVEDRSISSKGYSYEFKFKEGDFVEIIGKKSSDYYIPNARIYYFDINNMNK